MGRNRCVGGSFSIPKIQKSAHKRRKPIAKAPPAPEKPEEVVAQDPDKIGKKRRKRLAAIERALSSGAATKSTLSVEDLANPKKVRGLQHAEVGVVNEAMLRCRFPDQGVQCKYFNASRFKAQFVVAEDGTPVGQIVKRFS
eukprot:GEMP01085207.1.p1 GENE.GEMP01085207.1~~GEMP01085207.1.p1  ORF type:complete len:141 (+),score=36.32 GEMP01085207.1:25-447(+)